MRKNRPMRRRLAAGVLAGILCLLFIGKGTMAAGAQAERQEVKLEKSAVWESPKDYQALINLKVSGIEEITQKEVPISVIPLLDVTGSMEHCETLGHHHDLFSHPFTSFINARELWKDKIAPALPAPEVYSEMGQACADNMFLEFPQEMDPSGKCRLVYLKNQQDQRDYYEMTNWRVFYVTDDADPLLPIWEGHGIYSYGHTIFQEGIYLPVGTVEAAGACLGWRYTGDKDPAHSCVSSRMDLLKEGYVHFVRTLFENAGARICPVAFVGGYYINGWTDNPQEAIDFLDREEYLQKEQVTPDYNYGTNYEAALAGAMDAAGRLEKRENAFAILFTDGEATSGYDHSSGKADLSRLDSHSFDMPQQDAAWYPIYADWAIEDAQALKEMVSVYTVGYGYNLDTEKPLETLQKISSGGEYFIDSRSTSVQTVTDIFRLIYSDMIHKATKVHVVDYISEFWQADREKLPEGCKVEEISIINQRGQSDIIYKLTYPITREMGRDGQEEIQIPVTLREEYRDVKEKTMYETNQDAPLCKDRDGAGAFVEYVDLDGQERMVLADTPRLDVYPAQPDFLLEKKPLEAQAKAGEEVRYQFRLENCGQAVLNQIRLEDVFENENITLAFDPAEGASLEKEGGVLVIDCLGLGEEKIFTGSARLPEDIQGTIKNTALAAAVNPKDPEKIIEKEVTATVEAIPLSMDFQVEKTADRAQVLPGETLTYRIRIANTGERTLRSMVAVDEFIEADIQAKFQEQDKVVLRKNGTEAWIESILPGEEAVLTATAQIPLDFAQEELMNTVLVFPDGEKDKKKSGQASVIVKKNLSGNSVSENLKQPLEKENGKEGEKENEKGNETPRALATATPKAMASSGSHSEAASTPRASYTSTATGTDGKGGATSSFPKTEDSTPLALFILLLGISGAAAAALLCLRFYRKKHH